MPYPPDSTPYANIARTETYSIARSSSHGRDGRKALIGREAVHTDSQGVRRVGVVADGGHGQLPIITFPDGRWARCRDAVEVVTR